MSDDPARRPYLAFAWFEFSSAGGWEDYIGEYPNIGAAQAAIDERSTEVGHVVSIDTGQIVADYHLGTWTYRQ